jgi:hypothetical protein
MHNRYSKDDFAAVSVALDDPKDKEVMERVRKFLEEKRATLTNLVLDEKPEVWQEKLKFDGPPCVFVFSRDGKFKKYEAPVDYAVIEKYVAEIIKK